MTVRSQRPQSLLLFLASLCLQGDGEGRAKHELHTVLHNGPRIEKHEADRNRYCVNTVFTGNTRAVMTHSFWWLESSNPH